MRAFFYSLVSTAALLGIVVAAAPRPEGAMDTSNTVVTDSGTVPPEPTRGPVCDTCYTNTNATDTSFTFPDTWGTSGTSTSGTGIDTMATDTFAATYVLDSLGTMGTAIDPSMCMTMTAMATAITTTDMTAAMDTVDMNVSTSTSNRR
jgi:hypothetical protein